MGGKEGIDNCMSVRVKGEFCDLHKGGLSDEVWVCNEHVVGGVRWNTLISTEVK